MKKKKKRQCIIALKNKTVAPLSRKIVEIQKFCSHGNLTSHFLLLSDLLGGDQFKNSV